MYRLNDDQALVVTTDFFTPIVDDPYDFGRIAAANALSDVWAMGAKPLVALNLVAFPTDTVPMEVLGRILDGGRDVVQAAGAALLGGHSIQDAEPKYGLAVVGVVHPEAVLGNVGAKPGDVLILTKPIGTGIITTALKRGKASDAEAAGASASMATLNRAAGEVFAAHHEAVNALTDVTGYGLVGHLLEMLEGSEVNAELHLSDIPLLEGVERLANEDIFPGGTRANREAANHALRLEGVGEREALILCDAQTSGGLLAAVAPSHADTILEALLEAGCKDTRRVGAITSGQGQLVLHP